jgi:hypothetical protein
MPVTVKYVCIIIVQPKRVESSDCLLFYLKKLCNFELRVVSGGTVHFVNDEFDIMVFGPTFEAVASRLQKQMC